MKNNLEKAQDPNLSTKEFKELLDLQDEYVYEALDLNEPAMQRYIDFLNTQPVVDYYPDENDSPEVSLEKANNNDHRAQYQQAHNCMQAGDKVRAQQWFRKGAENGNIICAFNYAVSLTDEQEKLNWYKRAGFKGMAEAQREIGYIYYRNGKPDLAKVWFGLAVRRENVEALNDLGVLHWNEGQSELAIEYWQRASDLGFEMAKDNLLIASEESLFSDDFDEYIDSEFESVTVNSPGQVNVSESSTRHRISIH
jgi:TPR repeat protein